MEDTRSLLIMVLHKIFHDRPKVVEDTYQIIYNYNNSKREKSAYEKVSRIVLNICIQSDIYELLFADLEEYM